MKYQISITERQKDGSVLTFTQTAQAENEAQVIEFYDLNASEVIDYQIIPF